MIRAVSALVFFSGSVLAHPGHGALEVHWHVGDVALAGLGFLVIPLLVFIVRKAFRR